MQRLREERKLMEIGLDVEDLPIGKELIMMMNEDLPIHVMLEFKRFQRMA